MIPASLYIEKSTESLSHYLGQSVGGLVNATFGNLPEIFIGVATLRLGLQEFLKAQIVFWLLGATDGHAKNFSVFLLPGGRFRMVYEHAVDPPKGNDPDALRERA